VSDTPEQSPRVGEDEPPPLLGTWRRLYTFVVCYLAFLIALFYVFSRVVSP